MDVSTAYCNCDLDHIEERIYPAPGDPARMVDLGQVTLAVRRETTPMLKLDEGKEDSINLRKLFKKMQL